MRHLATDLRFAARLLIARPGYSLAVIAVLAIGCGANIALFGLLDQVLLRPLPYPEAQRLVQIKGAGGRSTSGPLSYPDFGDIRQRQRSFTAVALFDRSDPILTHGDGDPERLTGLRVTPEYLDVLNVEPALGRFFDAHAEEYGEHRVAVLSHDLWQRRFGGDPAIVGQQIELWGDYLYTVVGVMPESFEDAAVTGPERPQLWRPLTVNPENLSRSGRSYDGVIARLAPETGLEVARDDIDRIAAELESEYPEESFGLAFALRPLSEAIVGPVRPVLLLLALAVGLLLLVACANVANLVLTQGLARRRELAIRRSLGAGTGRLLRQLLTENLLLAGLGATAGLLLAAWTRELLLQLAVAHLPRLAAAPEPGGRPLAAAIAIAALTALLFGLLPALRLAGGRLTGGRSGRQRGDGLAGTLRSAGTVAGRGGLLQRGLVAAEVALALVLLVGTGLLLRSLDRMLEVDPGFEPRGVQVAQLASGFEPVEELVRRLGELPGVDTVGATSILPLTDNYSCDGFQIDARPVPEGQEECAEFRVVTPGYFEAMKIPLLAGRTFGTQDSADGQPVAVVNRAMAERFWPGEDPVGKRITKANGRGISREIVGVVASVRHFGLDREEPPQYFHPVSQNAFTIIPTVVVRGGIGGAALLPQLRREIRDLDPNAAFTVQPLSRVISSSVAEPRFRSLLLGLFGGLAFLLAGVGVFSVLRHAVERRTREIGLRMALGADRGHLLRQVLAEGMRLTLTGIAAGLLLAAMLTPLLARFLYATSVHDPLTLAAATVLLATTAAAACYLPARRASRVDPMTAIGGE